MRLFAPVVGTLVAAGACAPVAPGEADAVRVGTADFRVIPIVHASFALEHADETVVVDPIARTAHGGPLFRRDIDYAGLAPALVLVTDEHADHFDLEAIATLRGSGTVVVAPSNLAVSIPGAVGLGNGQSTQVGAVRIEAVPMYDPDGEFHPKGRGNGYVLTWDEARIYVAGDTACTPEMRALEDIDVAFLPMNLPYTMAPREAAECARVFRPRVVYPYHYRGQEPTDFRYAVQGTEMDVRILAWY